MGSPKLWWYPRGATSVQSIELPRISDIIDRPGRVISEAAPVGGVSQYTDLGATREVELVIEKLDSTLHASTIRSLQSLDSHLRSGGAIALALDSDKAVAHAVSGATAGAVTVSLHHTANLLAAYNSSAALSASDDITIEDANPDHRRTRTTYTSITGSRVTIGQATPYSFGTAILRQRDFYPVLRMAAADAQQMQWLKASHRIHWTVTLRLQERIGELMALVDLGAELADSTTDVSLGGRTLENLLSAKQGSQVSGIEQVYSGPNNSVEISRLPDSSATWWGR